MYTPQLAAHLSLPLVIVIVFPTRPILSHALCINKHFLFCFFYKNCQSKLGNTVFKPALHLHVVCWSYEPKKLPATMRVVSSCACYLIQDQWRLHMISVCIPAGLPGCSWTRVSESDPPAGAWPRGYRCWPCCGCAVRCVLRSPCLRFLKSVWSNTGTVTLLV